MGAGDGWPRTVEPDGQSVATTGRRDATEVDPELRRGTGVINRSRTRPPGWADDLRMASVRSLARNAS